MNLTDSFPFGKFKGKPLGEIIQTEDGRSWLHWLTQQESKNPRFVKLNEIRNRSIIRHLEEYNQKERDNVPVPEEEKESGKDKSHIVMDMIEIKNDINKLDERISFIEKTTGISKESLDQRISQEVNKTEKPINPQEEQWEE